MIWAEKNGEKVRAEPNVVAKCSICNEIVVPKYGQIKVWHFAHKSNKDCDDWYELESEWHKSWKDLFPKEQQEVIVGKHRADIKLQSGKVIELQSSSISSKEIREREDFYGNMIWILNGDKFGRNLELRCKGTYFSFRWRSPYKCWWESVLLTLRDF